MRTVLKDSIRFVVSANGGAPMHLVIRVRRDRFGGWEAVALLHPPGAAAPAPLGRVFRARERSLAAAKMVAWVRRRYVQAQPLANAASLRRSERRAPRRSLSRLEDRPGQEERAWP